MNDDDRVLLPMPPDFEWGVATSAHQFEGEDANDSWSEFERAGKCKRGQRTAVACDWWANAERDFDLAKDMGVQGLRMSLSWSRIEPREGEWDERAIERYRQMITGLRARGIRPMVALHHFANPIWFERKGAFAAEGSVERFMRFARKVIDSLGDLCDRWLTFNEPNVYAVQGWFTGIFPPNVNGDLGTTLKVMARLAEAHAQTYRLIHSKVPNASVSFAYHFLHYVPADPRSRADRMIASSSDFLFNELFLRLLTGEGRLPSLWGRFGSFDAGKIKGTWDYVPANVYGRWTVAFDAKAKTTGYMRRVPRAGARVGDPGSPYDELYPQGIFEVARRFAFIGKPFWVLESGAPDRGDEDRRWVIAKAVRTMHDSIKLGLDIRGYHHWSLVDNWEWDHGWDLRFGMIDLDPDTQRRTPRPSAAFFKDIIQHNGITRGALRKYVPDAYFEIAPPLGERGARSEDRDSPSEGSPV